MRTFIFIKNVRNNGKIERHIVGTIQANTFPSSHICSGGQFEYCDCFEVTEKCDIKIGYTD